ncbi:MAG: hypothetical protein IID41_08825 [Planctomycetes bacterium]|nr:hypothetical protein [Planctomycetota bacterium]
MEGDCGQHFAAIDGELAWESGESHGFYETEEAANDGLKLNAMSFDRNTSNHRRDTSTWSIRPVVYTHPPASDERLREEIAGELEELRNEAAAAQLVSESECMKALRYIEVTLARRVASLGTQEKNDE